MDNLENLIDNLTEAEQKEMENIVTLLDSVPKDSLQDFEVDIPNPNRHKKVNDDELDRLASKNNALATTYQTKWSVVVFQDKYCYNYFTNS